jgi:hypothetical protein
VCGPLTWARAAVATGLLAVTLAQVKQATGFQNELDLVRVMGFVRARARRERRAARQTDRAGSDRALATWTCTLRPWASWVWSCWPRLCSVRTTGKCFSRCVHAHGGHVTWVRSAALTYNTLISADGRKGPSDSASGRGHHGDDTRAGGPSARVSQGLYVRCAYVAVGLGSATHRPHIRRKEGHTGDSVARRHAFDLRPLVCAPLARVVAHGCRRGA